jgi:hypothetical protein
MSELFDNISRIVASPVPRRQALKAIGGALLGAVFAGSAHRKVRSAAADVYYCCPGGGGACSFLNTVAFCNPDHPWDEAACTGAGFQWVAGGACCPDGHVCQGVEVCCGPQCCPVGTMCIGVVDVECCPEQRVCCNNTVCCEPGTISAEGKTLCCPVAQYMPNVDGCCPDGSVYLNGDCCLSTRVCTGAGGATICCPSGRCCGGTKCCPGGCTPDGQNCGFNNVSGRRM